MGHIGRSWPGVHNRRNGLMSYIFGGNTGITYDDLLRRRKSAQSVLDNNAQPNDFWSGIGAIGQAFIGRNARNKADKAIADRGAEFQKAMTGALGKSTGIDDRLSQLTSMASNPNFSPEQQRFARDELEYARKPAPARQTIKGADGYQYYQDDGSRVLPNAQAPEASRNIIKGADGFQYYQDDGSRVLPDVTATADSAGYGATPIYGEVDGDMVIGQLNDQGGVRWNNVPKEKWGSVKPTRPVKTVDTGTGTAVLNSMTGAVQGNIGKDIAGAEAEKVTGKMETEAEVQAKLDLPQAEANANEMISAIDAALNHPGLDAAVGNIQGNMPDAMRSVTDRQAADFITVANQIQGKTFMQAYQGLKGGGQITEVEGKKAEAAIARLDRAQSEDSYKAALRELREIVQKGAGRARTKAGVQTEPQRAPRTAEEIMAEYGLN